MWTIVRRLCSADLVIEITLLAVIADAWFFITLASAVTEGTTQHFDERVIRQLRNPDDPADPIGPVWLAEMGRDLTAVGGIAVLTLVMAAVAGYLLICRTYHALWLLLATTSGGLILSVLLKDVFDRGRPEIVPHLSHVMTSSFPSGHSMNSAVVYLTLGALLGRIVERRRLKIYCLSVAMLLTLLVGFSRVYMGVHYPTDVLAGWSAGLTWALLCGLVARWLQWRGIVEGSAA